MADDVDMANERAELEREAILTSRTPYELPKGEAGECDYCGEEFARLVNNACARCRDKYNLG